MTQPSLDAAPWLLSELPSKRELRRRIALAWRQTPSDARTAWSESAAIWGERLVRACVPEGATIGVYSPLPDELDTAPLVQRLAGRYAVAFPRIEGDQLRFVVCEARELEAGPLGIPSPPESREAEEPALAFLPGRAFGPSGERLGRGGGYYDRWMSVQSPSMRHVGYGAALQCGHRWRVDAHDRPVQWIVSGAGIAPGSCPWPSGEQPTD